MRVDDKQDSLPGLPEPLERAENDGEEAKGRARLKEVDRKQLLLRTIDVERLIEEEHPARAIWDFVAQLDLSGLPLRANILETLCSLKLVSRAEEDHE